MFERTHDSLDLVVIENLLRHRDEVGGSRPVNVVVPVSTPPIVENVVAVTHRKNHYGRCCSRCQRLVVVEKLTNGGFRRGEVREHLWRHEQNDRLGTHRASRSGWGIAASQHSSGDGKSSERSHV